MPAPTISTSTCSTPSSILVLAGCVIVMPDPPVHVGGAPRRAPSCRCSYHRLTAFCGLCHFCHFPAPLAVWCARSPFLDELGRPHEHTDDPRTAHRSGRRRR